MKPRKRTRRGAKGTLLAFVCAGAVTLSGCCAPAAAPAIAGAIALIGGGLFMNQAAKEAAGDQQALHEQYATLMARNEADAEEVEERIDEELEEIEDLEERIQELRERGDDPEEEDPDPEEGTGEGHDTDEGIGTTEDAPKAPEKSEAAESESPVEVARAAGMAKVQGQYVRVLGGLKFAIGTELNTAGLSDHPLARELVAYVATVQEKEQKRLGEYQLKARDYRGERPNDESEGRRRARDNAVSQLERFKDTATRAANGLPAETDEGRRGKKAFAAIANLVDRAIGEVTDEADQT